MIFAILLAGFVAFFVGVVVGAYHMKAGHIDFKSDGFITVDICDSDVGLSNMQINVDVDELITKDYIMIKLVKRIDDSKE